MRNRKLATVKILVLLVSIVALVVAPLEKASTQTPQSGASSNASGCPCDNLRCASKDQPPKKDPPPGDPKKDSTQFTTMAGVPHDPKNPYIRDKDLSGFDDGAGTAPDTQADTAAGPGSGSPFSRQRRSVYNQLQFARQQHRGGLITADELKNKLGEFEKELDRISQSEREANQDELKSQHLDQQNDIAGRVNTENAKKTEELVKQIEKADFNQPIDALIDQVEQVLNDNLRQGHAQSGYGGDTGSPLERAANMIRKLFDKIAKECDKKKVGVTNVRRVATLAQKLGVATEDEIAAVLERCSSRTLIARSTFRGITYEFKRCLPATSSPGRDSLAGDWLLLITGEMEGSGSADVGTGGTGTWTANATAGGAQIYQNGPVELSNGPGPCQMKFTASIARGTVAGYTVSMPGVSGSLPVKLLDDVCTIK